MKERKTLKLVFLSSMSPGFDFLHKLFFTIAKNPSGNRIGGPLLSQPSERTAETAWTVGKIIDWTTAHLKKHGSESPRLEAEILLAHARNCPRIQLYVHYNELLSDEERATMRELVRRRAQAEPVAYLVGHRE